MGRSISLELSQKFRKFYSELTEYFLQAGNCLHDEEPHHGDN
ncbi:hypothetical protein RINTHH_340 [Richelia intracellularis HH01]|uniref:Uncharacterized protein n=1 Tax=Richelia intracellularis HH01 TaxID=1165094 RepID=M1WQ67_9NOST|nr:hypothetical protein RINTHH_340 [Richelia intracellularis HH01]